MRGKSLILVPVLVGLVSWSGALAASPAPAGAPCTPSRIPTAGGGVVTVPCPPDARAPATLQPVQTPEFQEEGIPGPRNRGRDIDDWLQDQVDLPITAVRGFYETTVLTSPQFDDPGRAGVRGTWRSLLYLGILICLFAWVLHVGHAFHGTDLHTGRSPFLRLGIPGVCLLLMLVVPTGYEILQRFQEVVWHSDSIDSRSADEVLAVVLPPEPVVSEDGHVSYLPAGSIAPVRARLGSVFGVGVGLCVLVIGLLGGVKSLLADVLLVASPIYLGISALAHDLAPAKRWLSVLVRTSLLTSLFNAGWLLMLHLPRWMYWTAVDAVVFVALILPAMLVMAYLLWYRPLVQAFTGEIDWMRDLTRHIRLLKRR